MSTPTDAIRVSHERGRPGYVSQIAASGVHIHFERMGKHRWQLQVIKDGECVIFNFDDPAGKGPAFEVYQETKFDLKEY